MLSARALEPLSALAASPVRDVVIGFRRIRATDDGTNKGMLAVLPATLSSPLDPGNGAGARPLDKLEARIALSRSDSASTTPWRSFVKGELASIFARFPKLA